VSSEGGGNFTRTRKASSYLTSDLTLPPLSSFSSTRTPSFSRAPDEKREGIRVPSARNSNDPALPASRSQLITCVGGIILAAGGPLQARAYAQIGPIYLTA